MSKREANLLLMAHWAQAWTMLGHWQALNARLSKELAPPELLWPRPLASKSRVPFSNAVREVHE